MKDETKCGAEERKCRTYEVEVMAHESNSTEPQCEPRQVSSVKEDIGEDLATVKEETGKKWFCLATDLLNASSSADACENDLLPHDRLLCDEEEVCKSDHSADVILEKILENTTVEEPKQCMQCDKQFTLESSLRRHICDVHRDERDLTCEECGRKFTRLSVLQRHKQAIHGSHRFMCPYEGCEHPGYKYSQSLNEHIRSVHTHVRPYVCETCGKAFVSRKSLRQHSLTHLSENAFQERRYIICEECGGKFGNRCGLRRHKQAVHENHRFMCPYEGCNHPGYKRSQSITEHIRSVHTHDRPYVCEACGKAFVAGNRLRAHSCKHASENAFNPATNLLDASSSADVFGNDVSPHDRLLSEEERVLKILQAADVIIRKEDEKTSVETPKRHVKCDKQSASELEKHHFTCDECGGKFYSQSGLRRHNQATQENQLFMCPYEGCGHSGFKYNQALTKHIRSVHANVRSHVCKTCGEAFSTSCHLRSHYARHFFERKFQCKCGFWFRNEETLTRHERLCLLS